MQVTLLHIALGDVRRIAKDWQAALWLLLMPLVFAYLFGSTMGGGEGQTTWIPVIKLDDHELAGLFAEQLRQDGYRIELKGAEAEAELKEKWPYGVVIPPGFGEDLLRNDPVKVRLVKGEASTEKILAVQSRMAQAIARFTKALLLADVVNRPWDERSKSSLQEALERPDLLQVVRGSHRTLRPPPGGFSQSLPGMLVMFMVQMILTYGGATLVRDRAGGHLAHLLAAPLHPAEVYAGKVVARVLLAMVQACVLLVCGCWLLRLPLGDYPFFLLPVVLALAVFAGSLSMLAGLVCQTEKQVMLVAIFGSMILSALGGCWWPIEIVPDLFKRIAMLTPTYWGMHGLQSVLYFGRSYEVLVFECPILLGFAAVLGGGALLVGKWRSMVGVN